MKISLNFSITAAIFFIISLTSCVETVVVGSVATAVVTTREKSLNDTRYDVQIYSTLEFDFFKNGLKNFGNSIDVTVNEGRVLLTGIARDAKKAKMASNLAWKVIGVKEVIDEIQLRDGDTTHFKDYLSAAKDYSITARVEARLLFGKKVETFNYKITTVNGVVYLLGVAEDESELGKVIALVTKVKGVEKVISHIILLNDRRRNDQSS